MNNAVDTSKEAAERWEMVHSRWPNGGYEMELDEDGDWIRYDDYATLLAERDQLRREVEEARSVRGAAQDVCDVAFITYKARNGKMCSIEGDNGEACEIVNSDAMHHLRATLQALKSRP